VLLKRTRLSSLSPAVFIVVKITTGKTLKAKCNYGIAKGRAAGEESSLAISVA
jgi:hypothetical protein